MALSQKMQTLMPANINEFTVPDPPEIHAPKMEILCSENANSAPNNQNSALRKSKFALKNCSK